MLILSPTLWVGCSTMYYDAMELAGKHKRDILVDRVENARDDQEQAKEQFKSALERFTEVVSVDGGDLEQKYNKLKKDLNRCEDRAEDVRDRIAAVENVGDALFDEWETELEQYNDAKLKRLAAEQMEDTRQRYEDLVAAMGKAEAKMEPVLVVFRDQVLFLKHNLNARAIASLEGEVATIQQEVAALVQDMEAAINEANAFIDSMAAAEAG